MRNQFSHIYREQSRVVDYFIKMTLQHERMIKLLIDVLRVSGRFCMKIALAHLVCGGSYVVVE